MGILANGTRGQFTMAFSLPNIVIKPALELTLFPEADAPCALPCPKTQEHQSTLVDSWVHRVPENGASAIGTRQFTRWRSACPILWSNPILLRYLTKIAPSVLPWPKTQEHQSTLWTHESIGYPKIGISQWDAAVHYGVQLAQYCDQTCSFNAIWRRSPPLHSLALRLRNTKVPVWTQGSIGYPKIRTSAIRTRQFTLAFSLPNIVIKPYLVTQFHEDCSLCAPLP